jgi:hypothetical protein
MHDGDRLMSIDEENANALLIAAAPELFSELSQIVRYAEKLEHALGLDNGNVTLDSAKKAIAKAKGEVFP